MKRVVSSLSFVLLATATALRAQKPMTAEVTAVYKGVSANILKAAEKMPESDYAFKPAPEVRTFGQLIAHVADAQMAMCSMTKGEMKRGDAATKTRKADLVARHKASGRPACPRSWRQCGPEAGGALAGVSRWRHRETGVRRGDFRVGLGAPKSASPR